jgi:nicotinamide-nucleotide amidase
MGEVNMKLHAEIITIGDEILIGQTIDSNAAFLGAELTLLGFSVRYRQTVSDEKTDILSALQLAKSRADLVLITGGLGPTKDDITKKTLSDFFQANLVRNTQIEEHLRQFFALRNRPILPVNLAQADMPDKADVLFNAMGTASGMLFEENKKVFISLPGVPYEMKHIMQTSGFEAIKKRLPLPVLTYKTLSTYGLGESFLAEKIKDFETEIRAEGFSLAYLPSFSVVKLRLGLSGSDAKTNEEKLNQKLNILKTQLKAYIFSETGEDFMPVLAKMLIENNKTVAIAESCTAGALMSAFTELSGSSAYFKGGVVAYANAVKENQLYVDRDALEAYGAVSQVVVEQMALGVKNNLNADFGIATSGIAGPTGGTTEKPVGTVWIAVATNQDVYAKCFYFGKDRLRNMQYAVQNALGFFWEKTQKL